VKKMAREVKKMARSIVGIKGGPNITDIANAVQKWFDDNPGKTGFDVEVLYNPVEHRYDAVVMFIHTPGEITG